MCKYATNPKKFRNFAIYTPDNFSNNIMSIDINYILNIATNNEGVDVEFKETTGQLNRGMETLCGMINGQGGIVVFGVNNKGKIVGQEISDKTTREIGEALSRFDPATDIQPQYIQLENSNKSLIVFCSDGMDSDKPYMWDGKPYQRHDSVTTLMPRERFLRLHEAQNGLTYKWERMVNSELTISSLDEELVRKVVNGGIRRGRLSEEAKDDDTTTILSRLKLLHNGRVRNSAAILFGKELTDYPQSLVRLARFKGLDKREFLDNRQIFGNIFELASGAMDFFFKHLSLSGSTHKRMEREDNLEIPYDALREAIVNALCHRAWQQEASSIGIAIYDDRVEIENAGRFPASLSPTRLAVEETSKNDDTSLPPNPDIANIMFIGGLIEHWGRGLSLMNNECERVGLSKPIIVDTGFMVKVVFKRPDNGDRTSVEHQLNTGKTSVGHHAEAIPHYVRKLVAAIGNNWYSAKELREIMGFKSKSSFIRNYLSRAQKDGFIQLENLENPHSPNQRYGLTEKGKQILKELGL